MSDPLIVDEDGVAAVVAACRRAGEMCLDLEFVSDGRMKPELGLVQVAWGPPDAVEVRAIDATAVDPRPVLALCAGEVPVIAHAARQDLQLLAARFELRAARLFDTQVAASFAGMGDQVGYGRLVEVIVGAKVDKDVQFTNWLERPLSQRQLDYALDDVRYLPIAAAALRAQLAASGRTAWVETECEALCAVAFAAGRAGPEVAWRDVGGARKLRGAELAALEVLAAWRWKVADARNKPPSWILSDRTLVEIAQRRPRELDELQRIRGAGEVARTHGDELLTELALVADVEREVAPPPAHAGPRAQLWEEVFVALVQLAAERAKLPARWLAARGECEQLARLLDRNDPAAEAHPLLSTWRRTLVGDDLLAWVRGEVGIVGDRGAPGGVRLVPTST